MPRPRTFCLSAAALLWAFGIAGVATLGTFLKVNIALMLIAVGSAFFVAGVVLGSKSPGSRRASALRDGSHGG